MTTPRPIDMRLIYTDDGWTTVVDRRRALRNGIAVFLSAALLIVVATLLVAGTSQPIVITAFLPFVVIPPVVAAQTMMMAYTRIRLHRSGIDITTITACLPRLSDAEVQSGRPMIPALPIEPGPDHQLEFSEIQNIVHTAKGIRFDTGRRRIYVTLEHTRNEDITRLYETIRESWKRFQRGLPQTEAEAIDERRRLAGLEQATRGH